MSHAEVVDVPLAVQPARPKVKRLLLLVVVPAIVVLASLAVYLLGGRYVSTDNAYVKATMVPVSSDVSGSVVAVAVAENDHVAAGQLLFRIDPAPFRVAVARAEAKLAQARTDVAALKASYREKQSEIALARTRLAYARTEAKRQQDLVGKKFVSASALDEARQSSEVAAQEIDTLEQDLQRIAESLGGSAQLPTDAHPACRLALAELEQARLDLAHTEVHASLAGTVSEPPKVGQYLTAGATATTLVASDGLWIEANFPETDLTYVRPGQPVSVEVDTYPGVAISGEVESLSPATGAEFSVIPAQNATGNWVKITQRVPVRIRLKPMAELPTLRAGLSTTVEIDTGHRRRLLGLTL